MKTVKTTGFICAFPGCGKSTIYNKAFDIGLYPLKSTGHAVYRSIKRPGSNFVYDSDSSTFDKSEFPQNYIKHMQDIMTRHKNEGYIALVSSHDAVRDHMRLYDIPYVLVYPDLSLKDQYIQRYIDRGSPAGFIELMKNNWEQFIESCENDPSNKIVLGYGQYLIDVL